MRCFGLGVSLALAAFLTLSAVMSLLALVIWRLAEGRLERASPTSRAEGIFLLRTLPVATALVFVIGVFLPAFWVFEPRNTQEAIGPGLAALAAAAAALIANGLVRGWQAARATDRVLRRWRKGARPVQLPGIGVPTYRIQTDVPVVCVAGMFAPRLLIGDRVLRECRPEELTAMVRHESRHLLSRDNLRQLAFRACPDLLLVTGAAASMESAWHQAAEDAADDYTAEASEPSAFALANALLRVARMAPAESRDSLLLSSLCRTTGIERRVRRLAGGVNAGSRYSGCLMAIRALALLPPIVALTVALHTDLLRAVHQGIEAVVRFFS